MFLFDWVWGGAVQLPSKFTTKHLLIVVAAKLSTGTMPTAPLLRTAASVLVLWSDVASCTIGIDNPKLLDVTGVSQVVGGVWRLPCLVDGLAALRVDGTMLVERLRVEDMSDMLKAQLFPHCTAADWEDFWFRLEQWTSTNDEIDVVERQLDADNAEEFVSSGLLMEGNNSRVVFGSAGDTQIYRSDEATLSVTSHLSVEGTLRVNGTAVGPCPIPPPIVRCATTDTSSSNGAYTTPAAPTHGDYIITDYVQCQSAFYSPTMRNRWTCDVDGGAAYPTSLLCTPNNVTGLVTNQDNSLVYYVDAWASPPVGDDWMDLSGINTAHPAIWTQLYNTGTAAIYHDTTLNGGAVTMSGDGFGWRTTNVEQFPIGNAPFSWEIGFSVADFSNSPMIVTYGTLFTSGALNGVWVSNSGNTVSQHFYGQHVTIADGVLEDQLLHIAVSCDGYEVTTYLNGTLVSSESVTIDVQHYGDNEFNIGTYSTQEGSTGDRLLNGNLYYVRLYNTSLSQDDISAHFNNDLDGFAYRSIV